MTLAPDDGRHGTANGYKNHGCRCVPCREALRVWRADYRRRRGVPERAKRGTNVTHGRIATYNDGCRCDACRETAALKRRAHRRAHGMRSKPSVQKYPETPEARWHRHDRLTVAALLEHTGSVTRLCERTGADPRTITRALEDGLTIEQADRYALALGLHPVNVWPEWPEVLAA